MHRNYWKSLGVLGLGMAIVGLPAEAGAYPSSIVFTPTAESLAFGELSVYAYNGVIIRRDETAYPSPFLNPWMGAQIGILPAFEYGGGVGFGGFEIGGDVIQLGVAAKGILNAKAQVLTETKWSPSLGVGLMDVFPGDQAESLNMAYVMLTKTLDVSDELNLGRIHVGYANALNSDQLIFYGTSPFSVADRHALLAGYESPSIGPFYAAVDHVGGVSEVSSTNFALGWTMTDTALLMAGYTMSNDGAAPFDGIFVNLGVGLGIFGGDEAPAASEGGAPAPAIQEAEPAASEAPSAKVEPANEASVAPVSAATSAAPPVVDAGEVAPAATTTTP